MPSDAENVRLPGSTGSDWPAVRRTQFSLFGHLLRFPSDMLRRLQAKFAHKPAIREHGRLNAPETCRQRSEPPWLRKSAEPARIFGRLAWRKPPRAGAYAASETARGHPPMYWGLLVQ